MSNQITSGIHRGVSSYCWDQQLYWTMELEDMFAHMQDTGAYGLEILADGIIKGYPNPSNEWLDKWFGLVGKYDIVPVEYGHWVESRMFRDRDYTTQEALTMLTHDIKLASFMGFTCMRTKLGVCDETLTPVPNWREIIERALPYAEKYGVVMLPEIHFPTKLKSAMIDDYCEFIDKLGTKHFGLNIDFGVFMTPDPKRVFGGPRPASPADKVLDAAPLQAPPFDMTPSKPEDLIPLLPYVYCCHAKFYNVNEHFEETTIPYRQIADIMNNHGWNGYLLSEYEGDNKDVPGYATNQVRRHQVLLKNLLGQ
jgi:hypothetical protein